MTTILLALAGTLGAPHHAAPVPPIKALATWQKCRSDMGCAWYPIRKAERRPVGHWHRCTTSPAVTICTEFPIFHRVRPQERHRFKPKPIARAVGRVATGKTTPSNIARPTTAFSGRTELMLVTWYGWTGSPMANGIMPSVGWAACGYDLSLGTRVSVPGVGVLTCGDRIGFQPWLHIDVYGVPLGTSYRYVTVLP